jgi:DNA-binding protein
MIRIWDKYIIIKPNGFKSKYLKRNIQLYNISKNIKVINMEQNLISLLAMEKLMKQAGANRVSEESKEELRKAIEEYATNISKNAIILSEHAKRRTIKASDIILAKKQIEK